MPVTQVCSRGDHDPSCSLMSGTPFCLCDLLQATNVYSPGELHVPDGWVYRGGLHVPWSRFVLSITQIALPQETPHLAKARLNLGEAFPVVWGALLKAGAWSDSLPPPSPSPNSQRGW